jgi:hypothetical protein
MMEHRNINANIGKIGVPGPRYRDVPSPARTDGIGIALRHAFTLEEKAHDFSALLEELDRSTQL